MKTTNIFALASAAVLFGLSTTPASAAIVEACVLTDVTVFNGGGYDAADACYGISDGNITEDGGPFGYTTQLAPAAFFGGDPWTVVDLSLGVGTWSGDVAGVDELIIVLKQSTYWGAWYFSPVPGDNGTWTTAWDVLGVQGGTTLDKISHAFALVRGESTTVPEPGTLALFGLGLLGVGLAGRRRRKA